MLKEEHREDGMLEALYKNTKDKMTAVLEVLRNDFASIRTGRASIVLLEKIKVNCYNTSMPLNQVATINILDPHQMILQPWDKSILQDIEKAILTSDLGLTPIKDGNILRIAIPPLSTERRQELSKIIKKKAEEGRVAIRNIRREVNDTVKKLKDESKISEDDERTAQDRIQKSTTEFTAEIDKMAEAKEKEIMQV